MTNPTTNPTSDAQPTTPAQPATPTAPVAPMILTRAALVQQNQPRVQLVYLKSAGGSIWVQELNAKHREALEGACMVDTGERDPKDGTPVFRQDLSKIKTNANMACVVVSDTDRTLMFAGPEGNAAYLSLRSEVTEEMWQHVGRIAGLVTTPEATAKNSDGARSSGAS